MTTLSAPYPRRSPSLLLVLLAGVALMAVVMSAHALLTHGNAAVDGARCFNGGGTIAQQIMADPLTGRTMEFCKDKSGGWFVKIDGPDGGNITIFPRRWHIVDYFLRLSFPVLYPG